MCSPRRDEREAAPKASPVKEERNCVLKKKKKTCFTCRFLEDKEFVLHFVPYLLTQWCISSLNGRYQED